MQINRYILKEIGFSDKEIHLFLQIANKAFLPSSITKSINVDGTVKMIYHCESKELIEFLQNKIKKCNAETFIKTNSFLRNL